MSRTQRSYENERVDKPRYNGWSYPWEQAWPFCSQLLLVNEFFLIFGKWSNNVIYDYQHAYYN